MIEPTRAEWETWLQKWFIPLLISAILVNAGGLIIPILEPDGSLYATIAKTIARTGDFVNLRVEGRDWLDKPHFPFWMAAISFRIFGINSFAYKLPALLFWGLGAWYTWKLALSLYGKPVAQLAALVYVSAAHLVISNNDVRAEPYLTALVIGAVYHFYKASRSTFGGHLVMGALLAGCACMTKGPFVLITIGAGFVLDWIWGKQWDQFRSIRWWIAIALTAIFTLPELICLYLQFDLHPEKLVFGRTGVSGIRFFFWDSQFGRFFNTGPIKGSGDPFFYFHTVLWAFLPWSLLLYAAIVRKSDGRKSDGRPRQRGATGPMGRGATGPMGGQRTIYGDKICLGGALASFIVFSLSRFQLPHYLNILFPFFAILTAGYLYDIRLRLTQRVVRIAQDSINILLPVLLLLLCWFFHFNRWPRLMTVIGILAVAPFWIFRGRPLPACIFRSFWMSMLVFAFINFILYPAILRYQAGTQAGRYITHLSAAGPAGINSSSSTASLTSSVAAPDTFYLLREAPVSYSFEFDCPGSVGRIPMDSLPTIAGRGPVIVFAPTAFGDSLAVRHIQARILRQFPNFHISQLTGKFIDYRTRDAVVTPWALFALSRP